MAMIVIDIDELHKTNKLTTVLLDIGAITLDGHEYSLAKKTTIIEGNIRLRLEYNESYLEYLPGTKIRISMSTLNAQRFAGLYSGVYIVAT